MRLALKQTTRTRIGVDAGSSQFKAVQLSAKKGRYHIEAMAVVPRTEPGGKLANVDIERLVSVLYRQGFTGDDIVLSAPSSQLISGVFPVPPADSGAPREQIVRMELSRTFGCNPQHLEAVSWELPAGRTGSGKQTSVMAVGCPHEAAEGLIEAFEQQQMQVAAMDVEWMAAVRAASVALGVTSTGETSPVFAVIDLGEQAARITVLWRSVVVYARALTEFGIGNLKKQLGKSFDLQTDDVDYVVRHVGFNTKSEASIDATTELKQTADDAMVETSDDASAESSETSQFDDDRRQSSSGNPFANVQLVIRKFVQEFAEELRISLAYAEEEFVGEATKIALVGGGAGIPGLDAEIAQALDIETQVVTPAHVVGVTPGCERLAADPSLMNAVGLAMYGSGGDA